MKYMVEVPNNARAFIHKRDEDGTYRKIAEVWDKDEAVELVYAANSQPGNPTVTNDGVRRLHEAIRVALLNFPDENESKLADIVVRLIEGRPVTLGKGVHLSI